MTRPAVLQECLSYARLMLRESHNATQRAFWRGKIKKLKDELKAMKDKKA
jgi:hypothetical protein